jgi:predicted PurR-regulated permease PerM
MSNYLLLVLLGLLLYVSYLVVKPFLSYLLFSVVLVIMFYPAYTWLAKKMKKARVASLITVLLLIALLVVPTILLGVKLVKSAPAAYESLIAGIDAERAEGFILSITGQEADVATWLRDSARHFRQYVLANAAYVFTGMTAAVVGLFMMFFVMYHLFTQGPEIISRLKDVVPLTPKQQTMVVEEVDQVVHGVIEGQILFGVAQGILGGLLFWALGIPNALFWGFVMAVLSVIPFVGSFLVWIPTAVWLLATGQTGVGLLMIIGGVVISGLDNVVRPYVVGRYAEMNPALVLVGVLGGLAAFGFIGFVVGPLVLALLVGMMRVYKEA